MRFLNELHEGDRVNGIYLCKQKQAATTKNGKPYENLILQDKTGVIDGKIWDPNSLGIDDFDALDYIEIMGDVTSFAGAMQLNIKRARKAGEGEYDPADYLPTSENSVDAEPAARPDQQCEESVSFPASEEAFCGRSGIYEGV